MELLSDLEAAVAAAVVAAGAFGAGCCRVAST